MLLEILLPLLLTTPIDALRIDQALILPREAHPFLLARQSLSVSTNGSCGGTTRLTCKGSTFGDCCSPKGFCGADSTYCGAGCQPGFGTCPATSSTASPDGKCGGQDKQTCPGSGFGDCCSGKGFCGSDDTYCGTGCQDAFGDCTAGQAAGNTTKDAGAVSTDGSCGGSGKQTCQGSEFGGCCSRLGFCGGNSSYCGAGCQGGFGTCFDSGDQPVSSDGRCGGDDNVTCQGSEYGNCCSPRGFCGSADEYCGTGCQGDFGTCFTSAGEASGSNSGNSTSGAGGGMAPGAIAGATIGSVAGVTLLGIVGAVLWKRKKKQAASGDIALAAESARAESGSSTAAGEVWEKKADEEPKPPAKEIHEMYTPPVELGGESPAGELGNTEIERRHEKA